jgi:hypothetical protein
MNRYFLTMAGLVLAGSAAFAQVPIPGEGRAPGRAEPVRSITFEFHSGFWLNLHHTLYQQARLRAGRPTRNLAGTEAPLALEGLAEDQQKAWQDAVGYYAESFATRDLMLDRALVNIKNRLADLEQAPNLQLSGLRAPLIAALEKAAPVYRARWWGEHDRANRGWLESLRPLVDRMGKDLATRLALVYQAGWPAERIWVDVTQYAWLYGAYTTDEPLHITIASSDPRNRGDAAFEILFHEASHGLTRAVEEAIARECRTRGKPIPRNLWHALLLYTTREMVRRTIDARDSRPAYRTDREGLDQRGWQRYQEVLERHWKPYLDGRIEFDAAISRIVTAL